MGNTAIDKKENTNININADKAVDKKQETKRLLIYLAVSFGLTWIIFFAFIFTGFKWDGSDPYLEQFIGLAMLVPFLAHFLTRFITKEGFALTGKDSLMLGISFKNKKWKYYLIALFVPWIYLEVIRIIILILVPESFDTGIIKEMGYSNALAYAYPLITISSSAIASFAALGEEGGWRGYMMPKLMKLMSTPKAIIVGGIIWGLWHAPLTCVGHNFGTDYPGFPYVGIIIMCVMCTIIGMMFTYITVKTESIWPAAIMHAVNNGGPSILLFFINSDVVDEKLGNSIISFVIMLISQAVICGIIIAADTKKKKTAA